MRRATLLLAPVVAFGAAPDPLVASPMTSTSGASEVAVVIRDVDDRVAPARGQAGHGAATDEARQRDPRGVDEVARVVGATGRGEGRAVDARPEGVHACRVADLPVRRQPDPARVPGRRAAPVLDAADLGEPGGAGAAAPPVSTDRLWSEGRGLSVVRVPEGSYAMGVNPSDPYRLHRPGVRKGPVSVTITEAFWMTQLEVWQGLYLEVTGVNPAEGPSCWSGDHGLEEPESCKGGRTWSNLHPRYPVVGATWCDAVRFANALSRQDGLSAAYAGDARCDVDPAGVVELPGTTGWRLPTEAQWERAALGGEGRRWGRADAPADACAWGNVADRYGMAILDLEDEDTQRFPCHDGAATLARVGSYKPNGYDLYDTLGNVWEWTFDGYEERLPGGVDPRVHDGTGMRVARGGAWSSGPGAALVSHRAMFSPVYPPLDVGFRLVRPVR